jgi:hypothetical protein
MKNNRSMEQASNERVKTWGIMRWWGRNDVQFLESESRGTTKYPKVMRPTADKKGEEFMGGYVPNLTGTAG